MTKKLMLSFLVGILFLGIANSAFAAMDSVATSTTSASNIAFRFDYSTLENESGYETWIYIWRSSRAVPMLNLVTKRKCAHLTVSMFLPVGEYVATAQNTGPGENIVASYTGYTRKPLAFSVKSSSVVSPLPIVSLPMYVTIP